MDLRQSRETRRCNPSRDYVGDEHSAVMTELFAKPDIGPDHVVSGDDTARGSRLIFALSSTELCAQIPINRRLDFWPIPISSTRDLAALHAQIEGDFLLYLGLPDPVGFLSRALAHGSSPALAEARFEAAVAALLDLAQSRHVRLVLPRHLNLPYLGADPQRVPQDAYRTAILLSRSAAMVAAWQRLLAEVGAKTDADQDPLLLLGLHWGAVGLAGGGDAVPRDQTLLARALDEARQRGNAASVALLKARIHLLERHLQEARIAQADARAELAAIHASRSFRITAPLRAVMAALVRLRRGRA